MVTDDIYQLISEHQLAQTVKLLDKQMQSQAYVTVEMRDQYHVSKRMLETMLHYLGSPIQDPDLTSNYNYLLRMLYEVTDALRDKEWVVESTSYEKQSKYYSLLLDNGGLFTVAELLAQHPDLCMTDRQRYDELVNRLSMGLLYTREWSDELASLLDKMDDYIQQTALTATTLALLRCWHSGKLQWLLTKLVTTHGDMTLVRVRAVVGTLLIGEVYGNRLGLYEEQLPYTLQQIGDSITVEEYDMIWSHRLRMKYTPRVVEYVQKLFGRFNSPDFQQRFQEILSSTGGKDSDASPDDGVGEVELLPFVEDVQEGYNALRRLVTRGFDVNAFATSSLFEGSFFEDEAHWLQPFDLHHSALVSVLDKLKEYHLGEDQLMSLLRESIFQPVDIDYYGTIFRLGQLPPQILQGVSKSILAVENVINRTSYTPPQKSKPLAKDLYMKALQGYICQLARIFTLVGEKVSAEPPFEMRFGKPNPFAQRQTVELYDKHLDLLRAFCAQTKEYAGERMVLQIQIMRTLEPVPRAQLLYRLAQTYYEEERYMEAYFTMQQVPPVLLSGDTSLLFMVQILYRMEQVGLAINLLEQEHRKNTCSLAITRQLGTLYMKLRLYDKALPLLLKCEFEDVHPDTLYPMIAWCLVMARRWDEAKSYASRPVSSYNQIENGSLEQDYRALSSLLPALITLIGGNLQDALKKLGARIDVMDSELRKDLVATYSECMYDLQQIGVPSYLLELIQTWIRQRIDSL